MTNLTDKWKKGELPDGFYWCDVDIYEDGNITKQIESFIHHHPVFYWETSIVKVIEIAPSFSEYKSMQEENTKLKELLKECELWFTGVVGNMNDKNVGEHNRNLPIGNFEHVFKVFSQKINQVLGEE